MRILIFLLLSCFWLTSAFAYQANDKQLVKQRNLFQQAKKALQTHQFTQFRSLSAQLGDYPLKPYLDYLYLRQRLNHVSEQSIAQFLLTHPETFYGDRLRNSWLDKLAREKRWQSYLTHYQDPQPASRQCFRLQALVATDHTEQAFSEIPALWLVPHSQNKACDAVFQLWQDSGHLTDGLRWQRINLALENNQYALAKYLAKSVDNNADATAWVNLWQDMHNNPLPLLRQLPAQNTANKSRVSLTKDVALARQIIGHGIIRLARKSTDQAFETWQRIHPAYQFSEQEKLTIQRSIANRAALNREDRTLEYFADIPAESWRVRAALWQQDWPAVQRAILSLNIDEQQSTQWQYWLGRSQAEQGNHQAATEIWQGLIDQRDYYAFLAADRLQQPYQMNHKPITIAPAELETFAQRPAVARLHEFYALNMTIEANRQAYELKQSLSPRELQLLATLTHQWGWHNQTIALLGKAQYWDALDLRFPVIYDNAMRKASKVNGIDASWLFAIARQESAFNPHARSHVGATGLMQLMPKTGQLIAKLINQPLKNTSELLNPDRNIQLGSAYLRRMQDKNQNNPVLATASYNAGPHRVARWLPKRNMAADIWIENIPFNETRHYTHTVFSYAAIFDFQRKQTIIPLAERMPAVKPEKP